MSSRTPPPANFDEWFATLSGTALASLPLRALAELAWRSGSAATAASINAQLREELAGAPFPAPVTTTTEPKDAPCA